MVSTDICNMALGYLGQARIADMDENSEAGRVCKLYYDIVRKTLLASYRWRFAERHVKLALLDADVPGWHFAYALPSAALIIRKVYDMDNAEMKDDGEPEYTTLAVKETQIAVCTNIENAYCDYTADVENVAVFPPSFIQALAHALASEIAMPLDGSASMQQTNYQLMQAAIYQAQYTSAIQDEHKPAEPNRYVEARL